MDTAQRYGCEERLGLAIQESKLSRGELFLTDKVSCGMQQTHLKDFLSRFGLETMVLTAV